MPPKKKTSKPAISENAWDLVNSVTIEPKSDQIRFSLDGRIFTRTEILRMIHILEDLCELPEWSLPVEAPKIQSRAFTIIGKSKK